MERISLKGQNFSEVVAPQEEEEEEEVHELEPIKKRFNP